MTQGVTTTQFSYNGDGDRVSQTINSVITRYAFDPVGLTQVLAETTNGQTRRYVPGLAQFTGGVWAYQLPDGLGSVRQLTDPAGQITLLQNYDPFGNVLQQVGAASVFGYTGEQTDPTGLVFLRARYYNAAIGRFITPDSVIPDPWSSAGWNRYAFVGNNPIWYVDPSGNCPPSICRDEQGRPSDPYYRWGDRDYLNTLSLVGPNPWFVPQPDNTVYPTSSFKEEFRNSVRSHLPESWRDAYDMLCAGADIFEWMAAIGTMAGPLPSSYSNVRGPIKPPLLRDFSANAGMSAISRLDDIPIYGLGWNGQKTTKTLGILEIPGYGDVYLQSGYAGPSKQFQGQLAGMDWWNQSHVEAHAAAIMRLQNAREATLYLNRNPCGKCTAGLNSMLPQGAKLHIYGPNYYDLFEGQ